MGHLERLLPSPVMTFCFPYYVFAHLHFSDTGMELPQQHSIVCAAFNDFLPQNSMLLFLSQSRAFSFFLATNHFDAKNQTRRFWTLAILDSLNCSVRARLLVQRVWKRNVLM